MREIGLGHNGSVNSPVAPVPAIGAPVLDEEHEELQRLTREMLASTGTATVAALTALRAHCTSHFAREDEVLRQMQGGNAHCHLDEHGAVLKSLDDVLAVLTQPASDPGSAHQLAQRLATELLRWLPEHVQEMDSAVAMAMTRQRLGGAPVRIARRS
jgi:hemerythrin